MTAQFKCTKNAIFYLMIMITMSVVSDALWIL